MTGNTIRSFIGTIGYRSGKLVRKIIPFTDSKTLYPKGILTNSSSYLNITTYDGSGQSVHPCVLFTDSIWNCFQYLMVYTPYPNSDDNFENPSLRGSNDGINWYMWPGQPDPIVPRPTIGFHSDPNIVLIDQMLYLFYRYNDKDTVPTLSQIYYVMTTNPSSWTSPILTDLPWIRSPSFHYDDSFWQCWGHDMKTGNIKHFISNNGINWIENGIVSCEIRGYLLWHSEIKKICGKYQMLMTAHTQHGPNELFFLTSDDGLKWTLQSSNPILSPSKSGWDDYQIYKSSFVKIDNEYKIWYSAMSNSNNWHIGLIEKISGL